MACQSPYISKDNGAVLCGRCPACLKRRTDSWVFRLLQQQKVHKEAYFITLTYDNDNLPRSKNGFKTLEKDAVSAFVKRCRTYQTRNWGDFRTIKYYGVGEYGTQYKRPHYHIIMFDVLPDVVSKAWSFGVIDIQPVNGATIAYTAKYINKGRWRKMHVNDDRVPEFSVMSKGLGTNYLSNAAFDYHLSDLERTYLTLPGGIKMALPRYYRDRIYDREQRYQQRQLLEQKVNQLTDEKRTDFNRKFPGLYPGAFDFAAREAAKAAIENFRRREQTLRLAF